MTSVIKINLEGKDYLTIEVLWRCTVPRIKGELYFNAVIFIVDFVIPRCYKELTKTLSFFKRSRSREKLCEHVAPEHETTCSFKS